MSRDAPNLDEQYGPGAERADAEAQDDVATELQEAIDSPSEYNHRYWAEVAGRAVEKLQRQEARIRELEAALRDLYDGTAEYVYLNHLGDPHNTTPMRNAAKALGLPELSKYDRLAALYGSPSSDATAQDRTGEQ
jgi:hypothetical protein